MKKICQINQLSHLQKTKSLEIRTLDITDTIRRYKIALVYGMQFVCTILSNMANDKLWNT